MPTASIQSIQPGDEERRAQRRSPSTLARAWSRNALLGWGSFLCIHRPPFWRRPSRARRTGSRVLQGGAVTHGAADLGRGRATAAARCRHGVRHGERANYRCHGDGCPAIPWLRRGSERSPTRGLGANAQLERTRPQRMCEAFPFRRFRDPVRPGPGVGSAEPGPPGSASARGCRHRRHTTAGLARPLEPTPSRTRTTREPRRQCAGAPLVLPCNACCRAGDRTRTGDVQLGKLAFYQLNYAREHTRPPAAEPAPNLSATATTDKRPPHGPTRRRAPDPVGSGARREPPVRIELTTARLRIGCSTTELRWRGYRERHAAAPSSCPGADSNRDAFRHHPLKMACLPVSPPGHRS